LGQHHAKLYWQVVAIVKTYKTKFPIISFSEIHIYRKFSPFLLPVVKGRLCQKT
jgi:hypothetical protein